MAQIYLTIFAFSVAALAVYILPAIARNKRKRRFLDRTVLNLDDFLNKYYASEKTNRQIAIDIHKAVAKDVGVDPSQILPTDCLARELNVGYWWGRYGDELSNTTDYLEAFIKEASTEGYPDKSIQTQLDKYGTDLSIGDMIKILTSPKEHAL